LAQIPHYAFISGTLCEELTEEQLYGGRSCEMDTYNKQSKVGLNEDYITDSGPQNLLLRGSLFKYFVTVSTGEHPQA
jgi:hypothetical protein